MVFQAVHDACKNIDDLHLKKIFQEYLVGAAFSQTKKQHGSSSETYLQCLPYSPLVVPNIETDKVSLKLISAKVFCRPVSNSLRGLHLCG